ncbi:DNA alkylation repair protein [Chromobacterium sp. ATCC 53434]|uniref:DNA alkylation repair protein n=1 Tax=Chromobacterium sp. (strain ATCC 53434 / SC 14030) TaxID=2059672 RepID=UPI000C76FA05|nr:DNA alkylation repair protein [Chromobacterium sp. ATCC 53434]AUH53007.1 DNA alkylation repair protein [Chromobacterium sp. ATCC 53434]
MAPSAEPTELRALLSAAADPARAPAMRAYMRGQFDFLGVAAPLRRRAAGAWIRSHDAAGPDGWLALAEALWRQPEREFHYVALDLLARHAAALPASALPRLLALATANAWWDTVDGLAAWAVGPLVRSRRELQADMDGLAGDADFWLRRVAILHQLYWKRETDAARLFRYCGANAADPEFFIRKAIGWALREYGYTDAEAVRSFVAATALSPLSRREALKRIQ